LPFGPSEYMGLPGMVLDAYHTRRHRRFRATEIRTNVPVEVVMPEEGKIISREEAGKWFAQKWSGFMQKASKRD